MESFALLLSVLFIASGGLQMREATKTRDALLDEAKRLDYGTPRYERIMEQAQEQNKNYRDASMPFTIGLIMGGLSLLVALA